MALASMSHDRRAVTAGNKHQCLVRQARRPAARSRLLSWPLVGVHQRDDEVTGDLPFEAGLLVLVRAW